MVFVCIIILFYEDLTPTEVMEAQKRADAKRSAEEAASKIREERELEERKRERERKMMEWVSIYHYNRIFVMFSCFFLHNQKVFT